MLSIRLMGSNLARLARPKLLFYTKRSYIETNLLIIISPLLESVGLCPKVFGLSGFHSYMS
jgi:hypothetical protein